jgi:serine/threonine protein phosphatase PrpC
VTLQKEQTSKPDNDSAAAFIDDTTFGELELWVGVQSDTGPVRDLNEDHADFFVPADEGQRHEKGAIFLVADGMGGHQAGEVASRTAAKRVMYEYYADTAHPAGDCLVRAFKVANQVLYDQAQADSSKVGMGTTMVAAVVLGRQVYVANVGDSRAYIPGLRNRYRPGS